MNKIAIFGSYNGSSVGDSAILMGLLDSLRSSGAGERNFRIIVPSLFDLERELLGFDINISWDMSPLEAPPSSLVEKIVGKAKRMILPSRYFEKKKKVQVSNALSGCSALLIGGGNLVMDLYPAWPDVLKAVCDAALEKGVEYSFVGVGAGPVTDPRSVPILRNCLEKARAVYFRDSGSRDYCESVLGYNSGLLMPDLALHLPIRTGVELIRREKKALVNLAAIWGQSWPTPDDRRFTKYISSMVDLVGRSCRKLHIDTVEIFESNTGDSEASEAFARHFNEKYINKIKLINPGRARTVAQLVDSAKAAELAFVTRLHAGILAHKSGCEIVAVCYQPKVADVLLSCGVNPHLIGIDQIDEYDLVCSESVGPHDLTGFKAAIDQCVMKALGE